MRWKIRKSRAIKAARAKKPRITITAIAQWGKDDEELVPFCSPLPCPVVIVVGTPSIVVTTVESVPLFVAVADSNEDKDAATEDEDAAAAADDISDIIELANVVSVFPISFRLD